MGGERIEKKGCTTMTKDFMKKVLKNKSIDTNCDYASAINPDGWKVMIALAMEDVERALA